MKKPTPPKLADRFLSLVCSDLLLEEILGDLHEYYNDLAEKPPWKRNLLYWFHVFNFLRPFAFKKRNVSFPLNNNYMFKNHIVISLRVLKKNRLFSFINIIGLAISMSVGILMILFLSEIYSFDDFHIHKDNIYRVTTKRVQGARGLESNLITASYYMGDQLKSQVPGVEKVLMIDFNKLTADLKTEENAITISGRYASDSFFEMFSFKLLKGDPKTALANPNGIVLTESIAKKLFKDVDPIGQTVTLDDNPDIQTGIITGVMEDPPMNSHMQFDALLSLKTLDNRAAGQETDFKNDPDATGDFYVYLLLNENTSIENVESAMVKLIADHNATLEHPIRHLLQPMDTFVTSDIYYNEIGPRFPQQRVYIMMGLTLLILLSACFNYSNLSLASALKRSKEVSIRKVAGANGLQVFNQFLIEAVILAFIAFIVGFGLFYLIKPEFLNLQSLATQGRDMFLLNIDFIHLFYFLLFAIGIGCLAGLFPALFLAKLTARELFKDASKVRLFSGFNLRHLLIVFQFAMSISLVMAAVLVYNQYKFSLNYDLGYSTENIVNIPIQGDYISLLENEYANIPEVIETSKSSLVVGIGGDGLSVGMIQSEGQNDPSPTLTGFIDQNFLSMHEFKVLAGTTFLNPLTEGGDTKYIVVNEGLLNELDLGTPVEAIGKTISYNGTKVSILGVVKDFVDIGLTKKLFNSFAFVYPVGTEQYKSLAVKFRSTNLHAMMEALKKDYESLDPIHPFEFNFYDDQIANNYRQQKVTYTLISFLAFLAISISMLGLLGMAVFTTESRIKEISIRKVLGAGLTSLILLLSRGFLMLMVLAGLLAIPITLYIVDHMVLNEFLYRAEIGLIEILSGFAIVMVIGVLTIGWQIRMAAVQNPADLLRND